MNEIKNISIDDYHGGSGVSRSMLLELDISPYHYKYKYIDGNVEEKEPVLIINKTNALEFGSAFHSLVLEPEKFTKQYTIVPKINRTTKEGKELFKTYSDISQQSGTKLLCKEVYNVMARMCGNVMAHPQARGVIEGAAYEQSIFWTDPETGIQCKSRPDAWHDNMIVDLKSAASADYRSFQRAMLTGGYHIQAGMISEGIFQVTQRQMDSFIYVVVEKEPPYAVAVYILDQKALQKGKERFHELLSLLKHCYETNCWSSYKTTTISLPSYALGD